MSEEAHWGADAAAGGAPCAFGKAEPSGYRYGELYSKAKRTRAAAALVSV